MFSPGPREAREDAYPMRTWSTEADDVSNDLMIAGEVADWLRRQ